MNYKKQIDRIVAYKEKHGKYPFIGVSPHAKERAKKFYKSGLCDKVVSVDEDSLSVTVFNSMGTITYSMHDNEYFWMPKNT